jgi:hypothetical protein
MKNLKRILLFFLVIWCCHFQTFVFAQVLEDTVSQQEQNFDTVLVAHEVLEWDCLCVPKEKYIIIRSYKELCYYLTDDFNPECRQIDSTLFDFEKEVIIGFSTSIGGCPGSMDRKDRLKVTINKIDSNTKYICTLKRIRRGGCKVNIHVKKIICFPILPGDWNIEITDEKNRLSETKMSCYEFYQK